jgi:3-hydroxyisobutyrate dehydrogenase
MVPEGKVVRQIVFGEGDSLSVGLRPSQIFVDMSSCAPADTERLHADLEGLGISAVDAPVSGTVRRAKTGTLTIMAGGENSAVERVKPILSHMGEVVHAGKPGAGQASKALNNLLSAAGFLATIEVMLVAKRYGLDLETFLGILNSSTGKNNSTENKFGQFVLTRSFGSSFALDLMVKDVSNAIDLARQTETTTFLSPLCREICASAGKELGAGVDHTEVVRWLEARTGSTLSDGDS